MYATLVGEVEVDLERVALGSGLGEVEIELGHWLGSDEATVEHWPDAVMRRDYFPSHRLPVHRVASIDICTFLLQSVLRAPQKPPLL